MWISVGQSTRLFSPLFLCRRTCATSRRTLATMASKGTSVTLDTLKFVNRAIKQLPVDSVKENYVRTVQGACFSRILPTPVKNPRLVACSLSALSLLDLASAEVEREDFVQYFSGSRILPGSEPSAHCYCGHQFGNFAGQLGDGCASLLGEIENKKGERWELQLKGSGKTPYSRTADGRKVLRSSIREFLCSEAMHHLGIPTTRAGTCITSDDYVDRDIYYNGDVIKERVTVISRIARSFIRFGSFEIFKTRDLVTGRTGPSVGLTDLLHQLVDYVTERFYPEVNSAHLEDRGARTAAFFAEVSRITARLVALWQCVGFCHGVLNTDNMSIVGVTIDYGPFGFLDRYDPKHICNLTDQGGRYAFDKQPEICRWNLRKLGEALAPGGLKEEKIKEGLAEFDSEFAAAYLNKMRLKLGLQQRMLSEDIDLVESLLETMQTTGCDFTNGFLCLSSLPIPRPNTKCTEFDTVVEQLLDQCSTPEELVTSCKPMMRLDQLEMLSTQPPQLLAMLGFSPSVLQNEIQKHKTMEKLKIMTVEEKRKEDHEAWTTWLTSYRNRLAQEMEATFDESNYQEINTRRQSVMDNNNPRIVLRNHIAQKAVDMAEKGDFSEVHKVLKMLETPYSKELLMEVSAERQPTTSVADKPDSSAFKLYFNKPPMTALSIAVS